MLTTELTTVYLDTADLTQADIEQGEAVLEAVHCPKHHGGRGHAEIMMMCKRTLPTMLLFLTICSWSEFLASCWNEWSR